MLRGSNLCLPLRLSTSSSIRPTERVGTFKYTSGADAVVTEPVMVGVRVLVELVNGAVVIVALAPVCAAAFKAYAMDAKTAMSILQIPVESIALLAHKG